MKTLWDFVVLILIVAVDNLAAQAGAQTNFFPGIPAQTQMGAPSIIETNPVFGRSFQNKTGAQIIATTPSTTTAMTQTNLSIAKPAQGTLGLPPTPATNAAFGRSFQTRSGGQITTATTTNLINPAIQQLATPKSVEGGSTTATFLFASSAQSWIGQGQSLFATTTNGYNISLLQLSANILQFNISAPDSAITNWLLGFSATNDLFIAGIYSNAVNAGGSPDRLVFSGMGRADDNSVGAFKVLEATYSSNQIVSFAADFVQFDNGDTNSWNEGSIRYNSTIPDTVNLIMAPVAISFKKGDAVLTWSTNLVDFQLEYATNLPAVAWFTNNAVPTIVDGQYTVTNSVSAGTRLYRLTKRL